MPEDKEFVQELTELLNKHNMEATSNTPDFILARFLFRCLTIFEESTNRRDKWYGYVPWTEADKLKEPKQS